MQQSMRMDIFIWLTWAQPSNLQRNLKLDFEHSPSLVLIFLLRNSSLHGSLGLLSQGILFLRRCLELGCDSLRNALWNPSLWKLFRRSSQHIPINRKEHLKVPKELHWCKWKVTYFPPPAKTSWKTSNTWLLLDQAYGLFPQLQLEALGKPKDGGSNTPEDLWEQIQRKKSILVELPPEGEAEDGQAACFQQQVGLNILIALIFTFVDIRINFPFL